MDVKLYLPVFVILSVTGTVTSLQCYTCSSVLTPDKCGANFGLSSADTNYIAQSCTTCLTKTDTVNNKVEISRECSRASQSGCITVTPTENQCFCSTDLCNNSPYMTVAMGTIAFNLLVTLSIHFL